MEAQASFELVSGGSTAPEDREVVVVFSVGHADGLVTQPPQQQLGIFRRVQCESLGSGQASTNPVAEYRHG